MDGKTLGSGSSPPRSEDLGLAGPNVRVMRREDTPRLVELMRLTFGNRRATEEIWLHRYFDNPWAAMPGVVAEREGRIVATVGRLWRPLQMDDRTARFSQGADLIVLPEYRGTGLRQRISLEARALAAEAGAAFTYSFPGGMSRPRGKDERAYWGGAAGLKRYSFSIPYYVRVLCPAAAAPLLGRASPGLGRLGRLPLHVQALTPRLPADRSWAIREGDTVPDRADEVWLRSRRPARFQTARGAQYLRWRYQDNPSAGYRFLEAHRDGRLGGVMVVSVQEVWDTGVLLIMDWLLDDPGSPAFGALLAAAIGGAPPSAALALMAAQRPFSTAAVRQGFWRLPDRFVPVASMRFSAWEPVAPPYSMEDILEISNWFMTLGDSDAF